MILVSVMLFVVGMAGGYTAWYVLNGYSCGKDIALSSFTDVSDITMIGHRGMAAMAPENTLPSFKLSCEKGYWGSECDVHTTSDGEFVIMHDDDTARLLSEDVEIENVTYAQLREMRFKHGNKRKNYDESELFVPTLDEYLDVLAEYGVVPVIELKKLDTALLPEFLEILEKHNVRDSVVVISFNYEYLEAFHEIAPDVTIYYLTSKISDEKIAQCQTLGCGLDFDGDRRSNDKYIAECIEKNIPLVAWTIDSPNRLEKLYAMGVKVFTSNCIHP